MQSGHGGTGRNAQQNGGSDALEPAGQSRSQQLFPTTEEGYHIEAMAAVGGASDRK